MVSGLETRGGRFKSHLGQPIVGRDPRTLAAPGIRAWEAHGGQEQEAVSRARTGQATGPKRITPTVISPARAQGATRGGAWSAIT